MSYVYLWSSILHDVSGPVSG
jgi:hypothetical protein